MEEGGGCFEDRRRDRFDGGDERGERAGRDPLAAALGDERGGAREVFGRDQVADGLLPSPAFEVVAGVARVLGGDGLLPLVVQQTAAEEALEERVQAVLLAAVSGRHRDEEVAPSRLRQHRAAVVSG